MQAPTLGDEWPGPQAGAREGKIGLVARLALATHLPGGLADAAEGHQQLHLVPVGEPEEDGHDVVVRIDHDRYRALVGVGVVLVGM
jgi:hypothetical protein